MRSTWARLALVAVLATTALASGSRAMAQQTSDQRVFVELKEADMVAATRSLTAQTGIQFIVKPSAEPYGRVTLSLKGQTAEDAVRYICQAAGAYFHRDTNGVFIISHDAPEVIVTPPDAPVVKPLMVRRIKVLKGGQDVLDRILYGTTTSTEERFARLRRFASAALPSLLRETPKANNVAAMINGQYQQFSAQPANTAAPLTGAESGGDIRLPGEEANQVGRSGGNSGYGNSNGNSGFSGQNNNGNNNGNNNNNSGNNNSSSGNISLAGGQGLVGKSIDYISYDPTDNSIVVRGTEEDIALLTQYINMFDVAPKQLSIKVEFITTSSSLSSAVGYGMTYQRGAFTTGFDTTPQGTGGSIGVSYSTGNVALKLRAFLIGEGKGVTVQAPVIRTLNNEPASVEFATETWIFQPITLVGNGSTSVTSYQAVPIIFSSQLVVNPRINDDGTITIGMAPQLENPGGFSTAPDGTQAQNATSQTLQVVTRVRNGETIAMAGFTNRSDSTSVNRVPVLSEIPILGQFFKSTSKSNSTSELLIFVTPTILDDDTGTPIGP